jgi:hypothetical protein
LVFLHPRHLPTKDTINVTTNRTADAEQIASAQGNAKKLPVWLIPGTVAAALIVLALAATAWLMHTADVIKTELQAAQELVPKLKEEVTNDDAASAQKTVSDLIRHTTAAREAAADSLWTVASGLPWIGANFQATQEVAISVDEVARLGAAPLVDVFQRVDWRTLIPLDQGTDLTQIQAVEPQLSSAAHAVSSSAERLKNIQSAALFNNVAEPLIKVREELGSLGASLNAAANAAQIAPAMLGSDDQRNYLLMIQNNAESRASGGIPGALAVLTLDQGRMSLGGQTSASEVGIMSPVLSVDAEQRQIFSSRLGKFMQDVNLTPDFPTAATTAHEMWEKKTGHRLDGVISVDPVALSYLLEATGPVNIDSPQLEPLANSGLPTELNSKNVVPTLLSAVYADIEQPRLQDAYFAGVAREIFTALSSGKGNAKKLIEGITRGSEEGRVLVWSNSPSEQAVIEKYSLSGSVSGPSVSPAQFGVYFNDGTGAKMDYYVKRTVQLTEQCASDGYSQVRVRITSTNAAPKDAATSLPEYVTGGGAFGVPAGSVQTNIIAYGPVQSNVEEAFVGGKKTGFASQRHAGRPVGTVTVRLAPGQSSTVEFTFGKIVQHTEPEVAVTPTVQALKDVVLKAKSATCSPPA